MNATLLSTALVLAMSTAAPTAATQLTVYSGDFDSVSASLPGPGMPGYALVRSSHSFALDGGDQRVSITGLPPGLDVAAVRFRAVEEGLRIGGQRFDFALADQSELLRRAIGQRVAVEQVQGGLAQTSRGILLAAGDGLTLQLDDGRVKVVRDYSGFELESLPEGLTPRPTLRWTVNSARAQRASFVLDYPTGGLAWRAEYVAILDAGRDGCRMDFSASAQVVNRSGADFAGAELTLVAGDPRIVRSAPVPRQMMMAKAMDAADGAGLPATGASGEYHAYRLPGTVDLSDASVQQVPLLADARGATCVRRYEARSAEGYYRPARPVVHPDYGATGTLPVHTVLEFTNARKHGLGIALPAGRLRVFQRGDAAREDLLGEALIEHTAAGREVRSVLGDAFDLGVERTRADFRIESDNRGLTERITLALNNAKREPATVRVVETLSRWTEWEITDASAAWSKLDAHSIAFDVAVPAEGTATVSYSVRYRWPESVKP